MRAYEHGTLPNSDNKCGTFVRHASAGARKLISRLTYDTPRYKSDRYHISVPSSHGVGQKP
jgi:hypothetical protein